MLLTCLRRASNGLDRAAVATALVGATIVLAQMSWMFSGVVARYVFNSPLRTVTEGTALLLFPVAFAGLAFALREDAYPRVTFLLDILPAKARAVVNVVVLTVVTATGLWFLVASVLATLRVVDSGAASNLLLWPRYPFWILVTLSMLLFCLCALDRLVRSVAKLWGRD